MPVDYLFACFGQWRSQDLILGGGGGGKNNLRGSGASEGGGGGGGRGCQPSHSESFLHFDVVNGAVWCMFLACNFDLKQSSWFK